MNLLQDYYSDSETQNKQQGILVPKYSEVSELSINLNPEVSIQNIVNDLQEKKAEQLTKYLSKEITKNHLTGNVQLHHVSNFNFEEQYHNFVSKGFAVDPSTTNSNGQVVFNSTMADKLIESGNILDPLNPNFIAKSAFGLTNKEEIEFKQKLLKKRAKQGDPGSGNFLGPWAHYIGGDNDKFNGQIEIDQKQKEILDQIEEKRKLKLEEKKKKEAEGEAQTEIKTIFHGSSLFDYKGRSYILPPADMKPGEHTCYIPKKPAWTWTGHTKGVQVVRFFPKYGHFILSGSHDTKIKLWDVYNDKKVVRTYLGHTQAIRDLYFTNDGLHFLSAGYDKQIHYWDTETGQVVRTFTNKKYPYCVRFHPDDDKQYAFLCGSSNKKIAQFDVRTGNRTQQYDEHLGPVNTVTFVDNNRKFVSTSDDKKIFLWEFGIPVVVKHIAEPEMHSITATSMHPNNKYFAGQSSDNKIAIYDAKNGNFKLNRKKKFEGHLTAGYAIGLCFSPDGQFIASGDADGKVWFWDWKTTKSYSSFKAHQGVCCGVEWHPYEPSKFATCGWDGTIKYWD